MKLCRFGALSAEKPGLIDDQGLLRDLSGVVEDIGPEQLSDDALEMLNKIDVKSLPVITDDVRMGTPIAGISKYICIGLNYSDHAAESGLPVPTEPIIFLKAISAISGPNDPIIQPPHSTQLDWEVELGIVIGKTAQYVSEEDALDYVAGYCLMNDVSERSFQLQSTQWDKGKGCDSFGPIGPWIVTKDEISDVHNLEMWLDVNGKRMQSGTTQNMIFNVPEIVSYCSHYMTLHPGDVIATGTPPGVGMGIRPNPVWLYSGDTVQLSIQGLGQQTQQVVKHSF